MTIPRVDQRVYWVKVKNWGPRSEYPDWINEPFPRPPGPFPLPELDRFHDGSGFPKDLPKPILRFDKAAPKRRPLYPAYGFGSTWVVSDVMKTDLCAIDPSGFDTVVAETQFLDGSIGPDYWILDLVRFVDCFDVERSVAANPRVLSKPEVGRRQVANLVYGGSFFRADMIKDAPFFRILQGPAWLCTSPIKERLAGVWPDVFDFSDVGFAV